MTATATTAARSARIQHPNASSTINDAPSSVLVDVRVQITRHGGADYVFATPKREPWQAEERRANVWRPAVAELAPLRPHDLNHTGVALLAAAGVTPMKSARRAGHSSVTFTLDLWPPVPRGGRDGCSKAGRCAPDEARGSCQPMMMVASIAASRGLFGATDRSNRRNVSTRHFQYRSHEGLATRARLWCKMPDPSQES